jgi:hypothetical protein
LRESDQTVLEFIVARFRAHFGEPELQKQAFRWAVRVDAAQPSVNLWAELGQDGAGAVVWIFDPRHEQPGVNIRISSLDDVERAFERVQRQLQQVMAKESAGNH